LFDANLIFSGFKGYMDWRVHNGDHLKGGIYNHLRNSLTRGGEGKGSARKKREKGGEKSFSILGREPKRFI